MNIPTTGLRKSTNIAFFSGTEISPNLNHDNMLVENQPYSLIYDGSINIGHATLLLRFKHKYTISSLVY